MGIRDWSSDVFSSDLTVDRVETLPCTARVRRNRPSGCSGAIARGFRMTTYVRVHGGGMGGWVWKYVAAPLRAEGDIGHTPTLTGFGERHHLISRDITTATHVADAVNLTRFEAVEIGRASCRERVCQYV